MRTKIQWLMSQQKEQVLTSPFLALHGYSHQLINRYVNSGWLEPITRGAFVRCNNPFTWDGGLQAMQQQLGLPVHLGGRSALKCHGVYRYARTRFDVLLCSPTKTYLPAWYAVACEGRHSYHAITYSWLKDTSLGLVTQKSDAGFDITIAGIERAMLEFLSLVPQYYHYNEAPYLMERLTTSRIDIALVQALLTSSTHIKANRLFLHLASECSHRWLSKLDMSKIALGAGNRVLPGATRRDPEYKLYIPDLSLSKGWGKQHAVF